MNSTTPEIDIDELEAGLAGATVIDIRELSEYVAGHVPGAELVPIPSWPSASARWRRAVRSTSSAPRATAAPR
jgi:rhodanese-related sulfurtransferase